MMRVYNTMSGEKEPMVPVDETVTMYVCGSTVYSESHMGHAMSYLVFDTIRRYLEFRGYAVRHVTNFTDIDDKIIDRAQRLGITAHELAQRHIDAYFDDARALNLLPAHVYPRVTEEIPDIIQIIQRLIDRGHAYGRDGDVYFRVTSFVDYGQLSRRTLEGMMAGARVELGEAKEHPMDFVLWKAAKPGEPAWESPWGMGRPGWHIECSAMAMKYLGETITIHGGGQDLVFPHHENERAQSEAYTGRSPFAHYWLHNGLLQMGEEKMSKSLGNFITIHQALERYSADTIRLFILGSHYRSPLTYSESGLQAADRGLRRLVQAAAVQERSEGDGAPVVASPAQDRFVEAMDDDFNTPQALAVLFDLARDINRAREAGGRITEAQDMLRHLAGVLGMTLERREAPAETQEVRPFIDLLVETRGELRAARQWALADRIRDRLTDLGIQLEDAPQGTTWHQRG